jgi:hypothetical protein
MAQVPTNIDLRAQNKDTRLILKSRTNCREFGNFPDAFVKNFDKMPALRLTKASFQVKKHLSY